MKGLGTVFATWALLAVCSSAACSSENEGYGYSLTPDLVPDCSDEEQVFDAMAGSGPPPATLGEGGVDIATLASVPPACSGGKVVHFVYFVEADQPFEESTRANIERQAFAFQRYWYDQLGVTFYLNYPVVDVIRGEHDAYWYVATPDETQTEAKWYRLENIQREVHAKLGVSDDDPDHRIVNYPVARHDGRVGATLGGAWMDGDDLGCIANGGFSYPYDGCAPAHCMGHVAHEFGHVLGLDHWGEPSGCMMTGFYTNDPARLCSLELTNAEYVRSTPDNQGWFEALPGELCTGR